MGKDKRKWRKLVKKLRRKRKRQSLAQSQSTLSSEQTENVVDDEVSGTDNENEDNPVEEGANLCFFLSNEEWEYREEQAKLEFAMKKAEKEHLEEIEVEKQRKIRKEWEAKQEEERKLKEEKERQEKLMKEKQVQRFPSLTLTDAEFDEFLSFLSGDIETPPTKYLMPDTSQTEDDAEVCYYFGRTAACRFHERCTKLHPRPTLSTAILIPNWFSHFKLEQSVRDEYDTDIGLEYEDKELYKEFLEFYDDVVPELRKHGTLMQFKVCCNLEPHLRGNVYIQYETIKEAVEAFRKFNGRFYNGRQLSLQFIKMNSWRSAICGSFLRKACLKGRTCNYLHVFRNPTKEFVQADHDWKTNHARSSHTSVSSLPAKSVPLDLVPPSSCPNQSDSTRQNETTHQNNVSASERNGESPSASHSSVSIDNSSQGNSYKPSLKARKHSKRKHGEKSRSRSPSKKKKNKKDKKKKGKKHKKKHKKLDKSKK